jgi:hypothetical protein
MSEVFSSSEKKKKILHDKKCMDFLSVSVAYV